VEWWEGDGTKKEHDEKRGRHCQQPCLSHSSREMRRTLRGRGFATMGGSKAEASDQGKEG